MALAGYYAGSRATPRIEVNVNVFETAWYQDVRSTMTPGENLKIYRENHGLTQAQLGEMLGGMSRQHISEMERQVRSISLRNDSETGEAVQGFS